MPHTDLFAIAFWPLIVLGLVFGMIARFVKPLHSRVRTGMVVVAAGLLLIPFAIVVVLGHASALLVADEYAFMIVIGLVFVLLRPRRLRKPFRAAALVVGLVCFGYGLWNFAGDFVLRREEIDGEVTRLEQATSIGFRSRYAIEVDGQRYATTADLFELAGSGKRVHAEVGRGSGMILRLEPLPF